MQETTVDSASGHRPKPTKVGKILALYLQKAMILHTLGYYSTYFRLIFYIL